MSAEPKAAFVSACCIHSLWPAICLSVALFGAGMAVAYGLVNLRSSERVVSVRGLSERDVKADLAIWPITYTVTDNSLEAAQARLEQQGRDVERFLATQGLPEGEVRVQRMEVTDLLAQAYRPDNVENGRYILTKTYLVRTANVDLVDKMARNVGDLIGKGVILAQGTAPSYVFTKLNDIKPAMIAEATRSAREAAEKFAEDSGAGVGAIKRASQGLFQIMNRDDDNASESTVIDKRVRVVTSVDYVIE